MVKAHNLVDLITDELEWPENWPNSVKKDFEVWVKNSLTNPNFQHKKKLNEILDNLSSHVEIKEG